MTATEAPKAQPRRFAVVMDWVFSQFQEDTKRGIDRYMREQGLEAVYLGVGSMNPSVPEDQAKDAFFDLIADEGFDGAIVVTNVLVNAGGELRLRERLASLRGIPIVSIGPSLAGEDNVLIDNALGMGMIMRHLIEHHGYRDFAYVSGPASNEEARSRLEAYRASLTAAGIPCREDAVFYGSFVPSSGEEAVEELLGRRGLEPDAIVCANDLMALGVWTALRARGLSCPQDVAVTGFDDSQLIRGLSLRFTTARQSFDDLAYLAAARLHAAARGDPPPGGRVVAPQLRLRDSCGCVELEPLSLETASSAEIEEIQTLISRGKAIVKGKDLRQGTRDLCRAWSEIVQKSLAEGRQAYELEEVLRAARAYFGGPKIDEAAEALINALRSTLQDECAQAIFASTWKEQLFTLTLRIAVDDLQSALGLDVDLSAHASLFEAIARRCGLKSLYLLRFLDPDRPLAGSSVIYGYEAAGEAWAPAPGSAFPRGRGTLAANMLTVDGRRYGYFLADSGAAPPSAFDYLRIRLSGILRDREIMGNARRLNADLTMEIAARLESERRLKEALELVEQLSVKDELTGLNNRRGFLALAEQQAKLLRRNRSSFFVLFADLDGLKPINDTWGHGDGDLAIRTAGKVLRENLRDSDIVARLGGDEFTALVSQANPPNIGVILKRIAEGCARASAELGKPWRVSLSIGHFYASPECELGIERMLELADAELYREKQRKRSGPQEGS